jgi:hypothetical protein
MLLNASRKAYNAIDRIYTFNTKSVLKLREFKAKTLRSFKAKAAKSIWHVLMYENYNLNIVNINLCIIFLFVV